jgi:hypothetical protein
VLLALLSRTDDRRELIYADVDRADGTTRLSA